MAITDTAICVMHAANYSGSGDWLDESGNGHDAMLGDGSTPSTYPVHDGDVFTVDGSQYFTIADHADLNFGAGDSFTGIAVATLDIDLASQRLFDKRDGTDAGYQMYSGEGTVIILLEDSTGLSRIDSAPGIVTGTEFAAAARRDTSLPELEAFVDGVGSSSPRTESFGDLSCSVPLRLGANKNGTSCMTGEIRAFALWDSALSDSDLATASVEMATYVASDDSVIVPAIRPGHLAGINDGYATEAMT